MGAVASMTSSSTLGTCAVYPLPLRTRAMALTASYLHTTPHPGVHEGKGVSLVVEVCMYQATHIWR